MQRRFIMVLLSLSASLGVSERDCFANHPELIERFSPEQLEFFCQQKRNFDEGASNKTLSVNDVFTTAQLRFLAKLSFEPAPVTKAIRREIRTLNDREMAAFVMALRKLKGTKIDGVSKYDLLAMLHHPVLAPGAHLGAAYLPWHREYLRMFESALRREHPEAALPYWAATLDEPLPESRDSTLWSEMLAGNEAGIVTSGPARYWTTSEIPPGEARRANERPTFLERNVSTANGARLPGSKFVSFFLTRLAYRELTACVDLTVERHDRLLHAWIGGTMATYYATEDFLYFLHHAYVDYLWEQFRRIRQLTPAQRETDYVQSFEACTQYHQPNAPMRPFAELGTGLRNVDGLNEKYTRVYYGYEAVPSCHSSGERCASEYLFCTTKGDGIDQRGRCVAKVRPGGNCSTLVPEGDACFKSTCVLGVCTPTGEHKESRVV